jgi:catechol 2,3-dioxygenase-like lactoylglutathione lyase family enzyme
MRVTGFGGLFFKSADPEKLYQWYEKHLGMKRDMSGGVMFEWAGDPNAAEGVTVWSIFPESTKYFDPGTAPFMMNFRVEGLKDLLAKLRSEGVWVDDKYDESEYGNFGWIMDPDGRRIELWEPPAKK